MKVKSLVVIFTIVASLVIGLPGTASAWCYTTGSGAISAKLLLWDELRDSGQSFTSRGTSDFVLKYGTAQSMYATGINNTSNSQPTINKSSQVVKDGNFTITAGWRARSAGYGFYNRWSPVTFGRYGGGQSWLDSYARRFRDDIQVCS